MWYKKFLLNGKDEDVPVMDDFNREKRFFMVTELKEFINTSLDNYYSMENSDSEFEDYTLLRNASLFIISMDSTK